MEAHDRDRHHGPYRLTRNPAYLGMALVYAGSRCWPTRSGRWRRCRSCSLLVDRGVIAREERYLERKFGPEYLDYKGRVRRWV